MAPKRSYSVRGAGTGGQSSRPKGTRSGGSVDPRRPHQTLLGATVDPRRTKGTRSVGSLEATRPHGMPFQTPQVHPTPSLSFPQSIDGPLLSSQWQPSFQHHWTTISTCDPKAKAAWFAKFQELFTWDPANDTWVKQNFFNKVSKLLRARWGYCRRKEGKIPCMSNPEGVRLAKQKWEEPTWKLMQARNRSNSSGEISKRGRSRHRMGALPAHAAKEKLRIEIGREPTTREMYKRFKVMNDGTYLDPDGEEIVGRLDDIERRRQSENPNGTQYSQVDDVESYAREVGVTSRGGLPRLLGSAATTVVGSQFHRAQQTISSQSVASIDSSQTVMMQQFNQMNATFKAGMEAQAQNFREYVQATQEQTMQRMEELLRGAFATRPPNS